MYEYKTVEIPAKLFASNWKAKNVASGVLQSVIEQQTKDGWEFYRVDNFSVTRPGGCLFGGTRVESYNVATFRREASRLRF